MSHGHRKYYEREGLNNKFINDDKLKIYRWFYLFNRRIGCL